MRKAILMLSAVLVLGFGVNVFAQERPGAGACLTTNSRRELKLLWHQKNSGTLCNGFAPTVKCWDAPGNCH